MNEHDNHSTAKQSAVGVEKFSVDLEKIHKTYEEHPNVCGIKFKPIPSYANYLPDKNRPQFGSTEVHKAFVSKEGIAGYFQLPMLPFQNWKWIENPKEAELVIFERENPEEEPKDVGFVQAKRFIFGDGIFHAGTSLSKIEIEKTLNYTRKKYNCDLAEEGLAFETYVLANPDDCEKFFDSDHWAKRGKRKWLRKPTEESHAIGIGIVREKIDCSKTTHQIKNKRWPIEKNRFVQRSIYPFLMQEFFDDLHLIDGVFKFDIRFYVLVANTEPLQLYSAPHSSFMRISVVPYGTGSQKEYVSNIMVCIESKPINECAKFDDDIIKYFKKIGITEKFWYEKIVHRMGQMSYVIMESYFEKIRKEKNQRVSDDRFIWLGFDYMLDSNLMPKFLEWNEQPGASIGLGFAREENSFFFNGMFNLMHGLKNHKDESEIQKILDYYQFVPLVKEEE